MYMYSVRVMFESNSGSARVRRSPVPSILYVLRYLRYAFRTGMICRELTYGVSYCRLCTLGAVGGFRKWS